MNRYLLLLRGEKSEKGEKNVESEEVNSHNSLLSLRKPSRNLSVIRQSVPETAVRIHPSEAGKELLMPYLPLIIAAHKGELPALTIIMGGQEYDLSDYVCRISAGIWYGLTLDSQFLPDWLENLRRIVVWWEQIIDEEDLATTDVRLKPEQAIRDNKHE
jgi:hypothetical protein